MSKLRSMLSNFLVFQISAGISSRLAALLFFIIFYIVSSSSSTNYPSLMSSWPSMIFWIGWSVNLGGFLSRFWKCSFHFWSLFSWQAALVLLFPSTNFIYCLSCYLWVSIFNWISNFIDLPLNVFSLLFLVCVDELFLGFLKFLPVSISCFFLI